MSIHINNESRQCLVCQKCFKSRNLRLYWIWSKDAQLFHQFFKMLQCVQVEKKRLHRVVGMVVSQNSMSMAYRRQNEIVICCLSIEEFCLTKLNPISIGYLRLNASARLSMHVHCAHDLTKKNALGQSRSCIFIAMDNILWLSYEPFFSSWTFHILSFNAYNYLFRIR